MMTLSAGTEDALINEAGRELAAFLLAVKQTQGTRYMEMAGTIWLDALINRLPSDCSSISFFRHVTVEAASSLSWALDRVSPELDETPETSVTFLDQGNVQRGQPEPRRWRRDRTRVMQGAGCQFTKVTTASERHVV
jgi:hypothetical protein